MSSKRSEILDRIKKACQQCQRDPSEVTLLAVSKKQPTEKLKQIYKLGQIDFGENYVQELLEKQSELVEYKIKWHLIGPLQTNKVNKVVGKVDLIHSVDNLKLAHALSEKCKDRGIVQAILLQINIAGEGTKSGVTFTESENFIREVLSLPHLKVRGLMTMPPFAEDPENSREHFKMLRKIRDKFVDKGIIDLSMGTTQDFEVAIEEGATIIRIGEAIFGPRAHL